MHKVVKSLRLFSLLMLAGFFGIGSAMAQGDEEITDEQLRSYIVVMDSVDALRAQLSEDVSNLIVNHELMDNGRAYNKIKLANGDTVKLEEEGITEEQLTAYEELQAEVQELQAELNETFSTMVKEQVGVAEYNKIRKGLRSDEELKARYEELAAEMEDTEEVEGTAEDSEGNNVDGNITTEASPEGGSSK